MTFSPTHAVVLLIGDELLEGRTRDANLYFCAQKLAEYGIPVKQCVVIPDCENEIAEVIRTNLEPGSIMITTGGLGPTDDDITLRAVALSLGVKLERNPAAITMIESCYNRKGISVPGSAYKQAELPIGAIPLCNRAGVAPGVKISVKESVIFCLPGIPGEVESIFPEVIDHLDISADKKSSTFIVRTWGISESDLHERFSSLTGECEIYLAYLPRPNQVDLKIQGADRVSAGERIRDDLGFYCYSCNGDDTLVSSVSQLLSARGLKLAVAESCTGGFLGQKLTSEPGASEWFLGGVISYDNSVKTGLLYVSPEDIEKYGVVSETVVNMMARGVKKLTGADVSIAISGIAGPEGGTPGKPVGTVWIAVDGPDSVLSTERCFPGKRNAVREAAVSQALGMIYSTLAKR